MRYVVLGELMRRYPDARVIFSGGSGILDTHALSEADVSKGIMEKLDLNVGRVVFESNSRNTWENATNAKKLVQPKMAERWALLAPAAQMPRAVGAFRKIGWNVLPWPTDYIGGPPVWGPSSPIHRFGAINEAEHEWLGLIAYWLTDRSSELLPGPSPSTCHEGHCQLCPPQALGRSLNSIRPQTWRTQDNNEQPWFVRVVCQNDCGGKLQAASATHFGNVPGAARYRHKTDCKRPRQLPTLERGDLV